MLRYTPDLVYNPSSISRFWQTIAIQYQSSLLILCLANTDKPSFTAQIQYATDAAKTAFVRLSDKNLSDYSLPDTESTWEELKTRITKTLEILRTANPKDFAGREHEEILIAQGRVSMTGIQALQTYFAPNFYFHVSTAYGLLRMKGVPLGKVDLLLGEKGFAGVNAVKPAA